MIVNDIRRKLQYSKLFQTDISMVYLSILLTFKFVENLTIGPVFLYLFTNVNPKFLYKLV